MQIICNVCKQLFEFDRQARGPKSRGGKTPINCLRPECRSLRDWIRYEKKHNSHICTEEEIQEQLIELKNPYIVCEICEELFEKKTPRDISLYCPDCKDVAATKSYKKWKKNNPEKYKYYHTGEYIKKSKRKKGPDKHSYRQTPQPKTQRYCKYPGCEELTACNGVYYYYCQYHLNLMQKECSNEYPECVYDIEVVPTDATTLKDGPRYDNI